MDVIHEVVTLLTGELTVVLVGRVEAESERTCIRLHDVFCDWVVGDHSKSFSQLYFCLAFNSSLLVEES